MDFVVTLPHNTFWECNLCMVSHRGALFSHFPLSSIFSFQDNLDALEIDSNEGDSGEPVNKAARIPVQRSKLKCMKLREKLVHNMVWLVSLV